MNAHYSIAELTQALRVSRSGYYRWKRRVLCAREQQNRLLLLKIQRLYHDHQGRYGSPRIHEALCQEGQRCGHNRIARLMRKHGIRARQKRPFRPRTTQCDPTLGVAPNHLRSCGKPTAPDQIWVSDITYIPTRQGWLYLAAVMDLYSRRIVGWSAQHHLESSLVKEALSQAVAFRRPAQGLLHHSDRGLQYASSAYQALLQSHHMRPSMSGRAHCYDNAAMESFWSTLKTELVYGQDYHTRAEATRSLFEYIELFYNRRRLHSALGYCSPVRFEQLHQNKL
jgi:transposase InsO family protein